MRGFFECDGILGFIGSCVSLHEKNKYQRSQLMFMLEAMFEYLIAISVGGTYLAIMTKELGMSDGLTGVLSSIISLGCLFQLLAIFYKERKTKRFVIVMSVMNQIMFMLLYVVPLCGGNKQFKIVLFVIAIVLAYLLYNFAHPKKIDWMMSLVDDNKRGKFTANKEILSLIVGMVFSYTMGTVVDYFKARNQIRVAFIVAGFVIFALMLVHTVTLILAIEKPKVKYIEKDLKKSIIDVVSNKNIVRITIIFVLYKVSVGISGPFLAVYEINDLGFNLKIITGLGILSSVVRIAVSRFWGNYADKISFVSMTEKCLMILALGDLCVALATPSRGAWLIIGYYICNGVAQGGINSALINLVFDYVAPDKRAVSLAICQAFAGVFGFLSTLLVSPFVTYVQEKGNHLFGIHIYAQQVMNIASVIFLLLTVLYIHFSNVDMKREGSC